MEKTCFHCKIAQSLDSFAVAKNSSAADGLAVICKTCNLGLTRKEKMCVYARYWRQCNPEHAENERAKNHLKRAYKITLEDYQAKLAEQNNVCAICKQPSTHTHKSGRVKGLAVDHCHDTLQIRGLLCQNCNVGLGTFRDSQNLLAAAIEYLKKYQTT